MPTPLRIAPAAAGDDGLAAQDAVLVGEDETDDVEPAVLDRGGDRGSFLLLLCRPQPVKRDEAHDAAQPESCRRRASISRQ
jgi:hypothetical protein